MIKTSLSIPETLCDQAEALAKTLKISRNQLFKIAIEQFIQNYQDQPTAKSARPTGDSRTIINQGDLFWVQLEDPGGAESGIRHPHVVIQDNILNHSRIDTVVACALTTNIKRANTPGNVLLEAGEANLPKQSVVEVSKVSTLDKTQLGEYIGSLAQDRINQILAGMRFLERSFFAG